MEEELERNREKSFQKSKTRKLIVMKHLWKSAILRNVFDLILESQKQKKRTDQFLDAKKDYSW